MTLQEFIKHAQWEPKPSEFDSWSNYSGADLSDYLSGPGRNRDSDTLTESNFYTALDRLGGKSECGCESENDCQCDVRIGGFNHWACGWYEIILVKKTAIDKVKLLFEIHKAMETYPVLDEMDWSEREHKEHCRTLESNLSYFNNEVAECLGFADTNVNGFPFTDSEVNDYATKVFWDDTSNSGEDAYVDKNAVLRYARDNNDKISLAILKYQKIV